MSNLSYVEFMKKTRIPQDDDGAIEWFDKSDFPNAADETHGSEHESFKKAYQEAIKKPGVKIYYVPNPKTLRLGFVEDDGTSQIRHTVRLAAWHPRRGGTLDEYILQEEIKERAEEQLSEIMKDIDPDDTLGVSFAMHDDLGNINYLSLWSKEIHVSSVIEKRKKK